MVYRYNIASNIIESSPVFDFASCPGYDAGISGGAYVGEYNGVVCFFGNMQQSPNLIGIYELGSAGWLSATNPSGEIASGASVDVELVMDGSWAEQGTFHANAIFKINPTQAENPSVYVTFTIGEPVYGSLSGVVTDSQGGLPIAGATVEVAGQTVTTGTNGAYSVENIMVGTYTILVSAANYYDFEGTVAIAEGTNTLDVQLDPINGINDYANVNVYPNPANTEIVVEGNVSSIYVSNSLGQIVEILGNTNSINVTDYKAGIYFLTVNTADGSVMRTKVVVAH
ncbi:MAG: carboxypeptidase regulatory-like domain-containing protein [Bacteroidales bacterium]|nr:carboxypeptidase regulatory-like domain-containing protein [Bacteroidales bacterium]